MHKHLSRGKRLDNGEWIEGCLIIYDWNNRYVSIYSIEEEMAFQVDLKTVGRCTGLTDKNGVKIFEGDVIRYPDDIRYNEYKEHYNEGIVEWSDDEMLFFFTNRWVVEMEDFEVDNGKMIEVEIIGNIHDDPEYLV